MKKNLLRKYVLLFAALVLLVNGVYAVAQRGTGSKKWFSLPLLLGSSGGALVGLVALKQRLRELRQPDSK